MYKEEILTKQLQVAHESLKKTQIMIVKSRTHLRLMWGGILLSSDLRDFYLEDRRHFVSRNHDLDMLWVIYNDDLTCDYCIRDSRVIRI